MTHHVTKHSSHARWRPGRHRHDADAGRHRHDADAGRPREDRDHPVRNPPLSGAEPANAPPNTLGLRQIMFAVEDLDDILARLRAHGAPLVGEVVQYETQYRLCYVRGPAGIIVALSE